MKTIKLCCILAVLITCFNCSKNNANDEQDIRNLIAQYDNAILENDADFFENLLASDYKILTEGGGIRYKDEVIKEMRSEKEKPTYIMTNVSSDSLDVKLNGDIAIVTGRWLAGTKTIDNPNEEAHNDEGKYTVIFERQNTQWKVVSEHITEKPHDKTVLESQLKKASEDYDLALMNKDFKLFASLFAEDYTSTNERGEVKNAKEQISEMSNPNLIFTRINTTDKNFRLYRNTAVETGKYESEGTNNGKIFIDSGRYTATWTYRDGHWKMVAEHSSNLENKK
jgi:ketosteroid isomerase-like protein